MELLPLFAKIFGPVFARMLFAYALRATDLGFLSGGDIAETLADSLDIAGAVDSLSNGDRAAKRNAPFIFETIGDEVAERVAELFVRENETPTEGEMDQALEAAKAVMNRRGLALLIQTRFDRMAFRRELSATPHPGSGWSAQQRDYYNRILAISADALFAAAEQIPHFTRDTTGQLLQDTDHLLGGMRLGLANQQAILQESYGVQRRGQHGQFEQDYRTSLAGALDRLRLFGVPLVDGARQPLSVAFVKMRLAHTDREDLPGFPKPGRSEVRTEILSVSQAFGLGQRLVVTAPAGLGKTTLLRWAAVQMARHNLDGEFPLWHNRLPFFLQLRDYSQRPLPPIADLPLAYPGDGMELLAGSAPDGWAREQLRSKRAAIFVDGLDEINEAKRQEAVEWVEKLLELAPETLFVLSGRPAALDRESTQPELTRLGFDFVALQPLDDERIDGFVTQWHAAMADTNCKYAEKSRIPAREQRLRAALAQRPELRHLAATPLIGAMLCALNLTEERELPRDRIRLYNRCVDMLLDRDEARQVDISGYGVNPLRPDSARRHLGEIAFWMLEREQSTIDRADAARLIASQGLDGERIARYLAERSGLLQPQSQEVYDFAHRTFQEFLAAQHIAASHRVVPVVKQNAGKKEWQETIALLAGFVQPGDQKELLETLLTAAHENAEEARNYHLLAWAFWELLDQRTTDANDLVAQHAAGLCQNNGRFLDLSSTQVRDVSPVTRLTSLKDLNLWNTQVEDVTPLTGLTNLQRLDLRSTQVEDMVPLAGLVSLQHLDLSHTKVGDITLLADLIGLQYLNLNETHVRDVTPLVGLTSLQYLNLDETHVNDITPLAGLTNLRRLYLTNSQASDVTPLVRLIDLESLYLNGTLVEDVTPLAGLTSLLSLHLSDTQVRDVTPLADLTSLLSLYLWNTQVADISVLAESIAAGELIIGLSLEQIANLHSQLKSLAGLSLFIPEAEDMTPLAGLTLLEYLDVSNTQAWDVTPLAGLTSLQYLDISNTRVWDATPLAVLTSLQYLDMSDTHVGDAMPLVDLTILRYLDLSDTQVRDVTPLAGLTRLEYLDLSDTQVEDVTSLAGFTSLQYLDMSYTQVGNVTPLMGLTSLRYFLSLRNTQVGDVKPLAGLTSLQSLDLMNTQVGDVTPLAGLTSLQTLDLMNTQVTDVSALDHLENLRIVR